MYQVKITDLGRFNVTVTNEMDEVKYDNLREMVFPHLVSSTIDFFVDEDGKGSVIVGGFRTVGKIRVTKVKEKDTSANVSND